MTQTTASPPPPYTPPPTDAYPKAWRWEDHTRWEDFEDTDLTLEEARTAIEEHADDDAQIHAGYGISPDFEDGRVAEIYMSDRTTVRVKVQIDLDPSTSSSWVAP